ncbi:MAG: threonine synthase [Bradymonadia bacterium]
MKSELLCVECGANHGVEKPRYRCHCGGTLEVQHELKQFCALQPLVADERLAAKDPINRSGVWRFREWVLPVAESTICTRGEGNTGLYDHERLAEYTGCKALRLKHEGENPTGSFKDRGMTAGITMARHYGMSRVAVASTGNTSASLAAYAAMYGMQAIVFIPAGKIALGKLGQALAYGAQTIQIDGDFDDAMRLVEAVATEAGLYLLNSVNPFRIEGQKAIIFELLQDLDWSVPDWIVVPGGNLGNNTALAKGLIELQRAGFIDRLPRLAVIQAEGASPLYNAWSTGSALSPVKAETIATAIRIGNPVSFTKSMRGLNALDGVVRRVSDDAILEAKAHVDATGIGAEPASCATVAGVRQLVEEGVIAPGARVCGILTGHVLKDPNVVIDFHNGTIGGPRSASLRNQPIQCSADPDTIRRMIEA